MNVVTGFFQIVAVLSAIPFVFWLVNFIQSPSLIGGLLVALGVVIAYIGLGLCALTGGVKL